MRQKQNNHSVILLNKTDSGKTIIEALDIMLHACDSSTEVRGLRITSSRSTWSTEGDPVSKNQWGEKKITKPLKT
jgi:hypothetical protein